MTDGNSLSPSQNSIHLAGPEGARLLFSGPPKALTGTIPLVNSSQDKQRIQSIAVKAAGLKGVSGLPLKQLEFYAKLFPGEQANISGTISLDHRTPPGSYEMELSVGERTLPATAHVTEVVDGRIQPQVITILAGASHSYTRTFIIENAGNVDLPIGARCEAPLFESFNLIRSLVTGLHKSDRKSVDTMVRGVLDEWADLQAGTLVITREPMVLHPGQKVAIEAEFQLPAELKPLHSYVANLQIYNVIVTVHVYTTAKTGSARNRKPAS